MDIVSIINAIIDSFKIVFQDIAKNWEAFLTLFIIYSALLLLASNKYHKHLLDNVNYDKQRLSSLEADLKAKEKEINKIQEANKALFEEVSSFEYKAFLASKNIYRKDFSEYNMFSKK